MIKRDTDQESKPVVTYICDHCLKEMPGASIWIYYPYGHICDSYDGPSHFCSDSCVVEFQEKIKKKYGNWKSKVEKDDDRVLSSAEWRRKTKRTAPKARRVARKKTTRKPRSKKNNKTNPNSKAEE